MSLFNDYVLLRTLMNVNIYSWTNIAMCTLYLIQKLFLARARIEYLKCISPGFAAAATTTITILLLLLLQLLLLLLLYE